MPLSVCAADPSLGASAPIRAWRICTISSRPSVASISTVSARKPMSLSSRSSSSTSLNDCAMAQLLQDAIDLGEHDLALDRLDDVTVHPGIEAHLPVT